MPTIRFRNDGISAELKNKWELEKFLSIILEIEDIKFDKILYVFTSDHSLLKLNMKFLNHDTLTDILTFITSEHKVQICTEIYISVERVKENALKFKVSYLDELLRVMVHGVLHLCGYSDNTPFLKNEMRRIEDYYLSEVYLS